MNIITQSMLTGAVMTAPAVLHDNSGIIRVPGQAMATVTSLVCCVSSIVKKEKPPEGESAID